MEHRVFDFYVPENGLSVRYRISTHEKSKTRPLGVAVVAVRTGERMGSESAAGISFCSPEDTFDIRVGVPLALKRALRDFKHANRSAIMREFFKCWPEAHPLFHDTPEQEKQKELLTGIVARHRRRQFKETVEARFSAVVDAVQEAEAKPEQRGKFVVGGLGKTPTPEEMAKMRVLVRTGEKTAIMHIPMCERCFVFHVEPTCP